MNRIVKLFLAAIFSTIASLTAAQSVTVTLGDPPFVMGGVESALAAITITETQPDVLQDGYFTLFHFETLDNPLTFTDASSVSGSATSIEFFPALGGQSAVIYVDADDSRIDSITVQLHAELLFFPVKNAPVTLTLGEDEALIPDGGVATGLDLTQELLVGRFGGYCCISIGDSSTLELETGESVSLPLVHNHPSYVEVESLQPGIARIETVSVNSMEVRGLMPGTALIQAWNPLGQAGYLSVTVIGPTQSPQDLLGRLIEEVSALVHRGLKVGQANGLKATLRAALRSVERGHVNAACLQMHAFILRVQLYPHLHSALRQELLAEARLIEKGMGCRSPAWLTSPWFTGR